jgi:NADH-quinone oxidoreductase subunit A
MNVYVPILLVLTIGVLFSLLFLVLSRALGPLRETPEKLTTYECGVPTRGSTNLRFYVRFYVVALLFLLFDLEAAFLIPWAVSFRGFVADGLGVQMFVAMTVFLGMLVVGLIYEWRKGALEWE